MPQTPSTTRVVGLDRPVTRVALGTMIVQRDKKEASFRLLDEALDAGIDTLDTALVYGSEYCIGDWIEARKNRSKLVILTKGSHHNDVRKRCRPCDIGTDLYDSLAKLKTDYVDMWMLHRDDLDMPVGEIVDALEEHRRAGRIKAYGGSNWTVARITEANAYAAKHGRQGFTVSSPNYSLAEQVEDPWGPGCTTIGGPSHAGDRDWYRQSQVAVFAYSSLARGLLSGRVTRENFSEMKGKLDGACQTAYCHEVNFKRLDRAATLAKEKGMSVPQIATAFILSQRMNVIALIGAASRAEIDDAVAASHLTLSADELAWLDLASDQRGASARG